MTRVIIENKDGEQYSVEVKDFEAGAEEQYKGFKILNNEDGSRYEGGPKTASAVARSQRDEAHERNAERAATKGEKGSE